MWLATTLILLETILFCFEVVNRYGYFCQDIIDIQHRIFRQPFFRNLFRKTQQLNFSIFRSSVIGASFFRFLIGVYTGLLISFYPLSPTKKLLIIFGVFFIDFFANFIFIRFCLLKNPSHIIYKVANRICLPIILFLVLIDSYLSKIQNTPVTPSSPKTKQEDSLEEIKKRLIKTLTIAKHDSSMNSLNLKLTKSILHFKDIIVRETMIPKVDLFSLSEETTIKNAVTAAVKEGYSRIPVHQKSIDTITGIVLFKDLLRIYKDCWDGNTSSKMLDQPVSTIAKTAFYTTELKQASVLLQELRQRQTHMAIVVNEYGSTEGIVTMEDLLEEIVGEILDEYDTHPNIPFKQIGNFWIVDGRMNISEAEEAFNITIEAEGPYDTLGGHVFHKIGSSPKRGMKIHHENFDIEILDCSERNIEKLKITPIYLESE